MLDRNYRDIVGGLAISVFGAAAMAYALTNYAVGTVTRMGPGMMPASLGALLVGFGLFIALPALAERGRAVEINWRPLIALSASVASFALTIRAFGFVPAVFLTTLIATFAESKLTLLGGVILAGALALMTWAVFILGLGLTIPAFDWRIR